MGCKYRVMDKCRAKDNIKDAFCFGKDGCPYYENEVEVTSKDQYEARLKADMVAMLEELKKEIDEMQCLYVDFAHYVNEYDVSNLIQQKINSLKENENDN